MQSALHDRDAAKTLDELRAVNARFIHNFITRDVASHDALLHPDFINITPTGQRWDRATYLRYWATAFDPEVTIYWDVSTGMFATSSLMSSATSRWCARPTSTFAAVTATTSPA
jgi:hypothetical protein